MTTDEPLNLKPLPPKFGGSVRLDLWGNDSLYSGAAVNVFSKSGKWLRFLSGSDLTLALRYGYFDNALHSLAPEALKALYTVATTAIEVSQERDRISVFLKSSADNYLMEWRDAEVHEAFEDGFLNPREAVLGNLERFVRQGGPLHHSALEALYDRYR